MANSTVNKIIERSPTLNTIHMVEKFIHTHSGEYKKTQIWKKLPKKTIYRTFCKVFEYLTESNKIISDKEGAVIWVHDPWLTKYYREHPELSLENTLKIQKSRLARKISKSQVRRRQRKTIVQSNNSSNSQNRIRL